MSEKLRQSLRRKLIDKKAQLKKQKSTAKIDLTREEIEILLNKITTVEDCANDCGFTTKLS